MAPLTHSSLFCLCWFSEELKDYLLGENAINKIFTLGNSEFPVSWENEIKLWTFLETRTALLLKTYKTTSEVSGLLHSDRRLTFTLAAVRQNVLPSSLVKNLRE